MLAIVISKSSYFFGMHTKLPLLVFISGSWSESDASMTACYPHPPWPLTPPSIKVRSINMEVVAFSGISTFLYESEKRYEFEVLLRLNEN